MILAELELRVIDLVDGYLRSGRIEDDRVEVKRELGNDPSANARQLGGLANAAGSEWVLWIVGIDEKAGSVRSFEGEISSWWKAVASKFDGQAPSLEHQPLVQTPQGSVQALLFNVERRPYMVKIAEYGRTTGVKASREVPWREGTATRTATREDLLRILVPRARLPEFEVRAARLQHELHSGENPEPWWNFSCELYASLPWGDVAVYPDHLCSIELRSRSGLIPKGEYELQIRAGATITTPFLETRHHGGSDSSRLDTIADGYLQVVVTGPGYLKGTCQFASGGIPRMTEPQHARIRREPPVVSAQLRMQAAGHDLRTTVSIPLKAAPTPLPRQGSGGDKPPRRALEWAAEKSAPTGVNGT